MLRLIRFLWTGCDHKWKPTSQSRWSGDFGSGPCVYVVCEKCGRRRCFESATIGDWEELDDQPN